MRTHGTPSSYNGGCRCPECTEAHRRYCTAAFARMKARAAAGLATFEHGAYGYTNWGCRCTVCTAGNTQKKRDQGRARRGRVMSVFDLGRLRHLDLLALWHVRNPDGHENDLQMIARMTKEQIAANILAASPV